MRASRSAIGSVIMGSPARFRDARELTLERELPHAQTAQAKITVYAANTAAHAATIHGPSRKFGRPIGFGPLGSARHPQLLNGMPRLPRSALASSSVLAVVT